MKRLAVFLLMCTALVLGVFAEDAEYNIGLSYDEANNCIVSTVNIRKGNSVVGHIGLSYNTDKLTPVTSDFTAIPESLTDSSVTLGSIVDAAESYIEITSESNSLDRLVNLKDGMILFGWLVPSDIECVNTGEAIASVTFVLKEDVNISDILLSDIAPVKKENIGELNGWADGMLMVDSNGDYYFYEPGENDNKLTVSVTADFETSDSSDEADENSEKTDETDASENTGSFAADDEDKEEKETVATADFGLEVKAISDKIKITWNKPKNFNVKEYRITVSDSDGYTVRDIVGITSITKSFTVKELAHDFRFTVMFEAVKPDGSVVRHKDTLTVTTQRKAGASAKIFNVKYKAGSGSLYGMSSEQVVFGGNPTKAPVVYAPDGYEFAGWSVDGKNIANLDELKIYSDTVLTAVYTKVQ